MADGHFVNEQAWPAIPGVSDTYCLYQRRYPRRLPKLTDPTKKSSNRSPKQKKYKLSAQAEEAMPLKSNSSYRESREVDSKKVDEEVEKMRLEDLEDELKVNDDIQFQKPSSQRKSTVAFDLDRNYPKYNGECSVQSGTPRSGCKSSARARSSIRPISSSLKKSSLRSDRSSMVDNIGVNSRKKVDFTQKKRSQSLYNPTITSGNNSGIADQDTLITSSRPHSGKEAFELIAQIKSQKETTSIQNLMKRVKAKQRESESCVNTLPRCHTQYNIKDEDLNFINDVLTQTTKPNLNNIDIHADLPTHESLKKTEDKLSNKSFFHSHLELDNQMKVLEDISYVIPAQKTIESQLNGEPISNKVAATLRMLLFGTCSSSFTASWREQTITYLQPKHYALKFYKDGPVDIMTPLQAYILKHLLFNKHIGEESHNLAEKLEPNPTTQIQCLVLSIGEMIWKAGEKKHGIIALPIGECQFIQEYSYRNDEITEKMELFKFTEWDMLHVFIKQNIHKFQQVNGYGCISLLYSLMLTRGLSNFFEDCSELKHGIFETSDTSGRSQSLINLCISGKAVPNVFNKDTEFFDEVEDRTKIYRGMEKRCEFGYLTYAEYVDKKLCEVGSCLKTPIYPIWVLNNDSKLSVLFCLKKELLSDWKLERRFDLYYYQGIPKYVQTCDIDIRLTVDTVQPFTPNDPEEEENSTLEETLRTKWTDSVIEWNGYTRF